MALIDGFMTIVGAVTGMGKSGQDDVLAEIKKSRASAAFASKQDRAYLKAVEQAKRIEKNTPILTHRQKQQEDYYRSVKDMVDQFDMLSDKKRKFAYDAVKREYDNLYRKNSIDPQAQNLANDRLVNGLLVPQTEVQEDRTTVSPMKIGT